MENRSQSVNLHMHREHAEKWSVRRVVPLPSGQPRAFWCVLICPAGVRCACTRSLGSVSKGLKCQD